MASVSVENLKVMETEQMIYVLLIQIVNNINIQVIKVRMGELKGLKDKVEQLLKEIDKGIYQGGK